MIIRFELFRCQLNRSRIVHQPGLFPNVFREHVPGTLGNRCVPAVPCSMSRLLRFRFTVVETQWGTGYWQALATTRDDKASVADGDVADGDTWPEFMADCDSDDSAPTFDDYVDFQLDAFVDS